MFSRASIAPLTAGFVSACLMAGSALAQQTPPPSPCVSDPHFRDFDFWLGEWDVSGRANGNFAGNNVIKSIEGSCALEERWVSKSGGTGMSINYYNPLSGKWRQVWLSGAGYSIDIVGGLNEEGSMVLEGTIYYYRTDKDFPFRGTWTPNADGSVRQYFQQADPESGEWSDWFDGLYVKSKELAE